MEKSSIYRTLQIFLAVAVYTVISIWAATAHVDMISDMLTSINSLLVILAIVIIFPYVCFKVFGKLTTPPASRNLDDLLEVTEDITEEIKTMQYRGTRYKPEKYKPENLTDEIIEISNKSQPVIKYRGIAIADNASQDVTDSFSAARKSQKSALPKERMKYRGSYLD